MKLRTPILFAALVISSGALLATANAAGHESGVVIAKNGADNAPGDNHGGNSGSGGSGRGGRDDGPGHTSIKGSTDVAKGGNSGSGGGNGGGRGRGGHDDGPGHT